MIDTAVIPAAGHGLRMRPLTSVVPKEMFPLGRSALIEYTIRELLDSGITRICVVIRKGKEAIKEYLLWRKKSFNEVELYFAYQKAPLGLGDAIRRAKDFIRGVPFVMAIPDQILLSETPATRQLLDTYNRADAIWNSMVRIPHDEKNFFKGSRAFTYKTAGQNVWIIEDIVPDEISEIRGFGRTVYIPEALEFMTREYINDKTGEVDLLKTFQALKDRVPLFGTMLKGRPCDLGTWEGYYYYQALIRRVLDSDERFL